MPRPNPQDDPFMNRAFRLAVATAAVSLVACLASGSARADAVDLPPPGGTATGVARAAGRVPRHAERVRVGDDGEPVFGICAACWLG